MALGTNTNLKQLVEQLTPRAIQRDERKQLFDLIHMMLQGNQRSFDIFLLRLINDFFFIPNKLYILYLINSRFLLNRDSVKIVQNTASASLDATVEVTLEIEATELEPAVREYITNLFVTSLPVGITWDLDIVKLPSRTAFPTGLTTPHLSNREVGALAFHNNRFYISIGAEDEDEDGEIVHIISSISNNGTDLRTEFTITGLARIKGMEILNGKIYLAGRDFARNRYMVRAYDFSGNRLTADDLDFTDEDGSIVTASSPIGLAVVNGTLRVMYISGNNAIVHDFNAEYIRITYSDDTDLGFFAYLDGKAYFQSDTDHNLTIAQLDNPSMITSVMIPASFSGIGGGVFIRNVLYVLFRSNTSNEWMISSLPIEYSIPTSGFVREIGDIDDQETLGAAFFYEGSYYVTFNDEPDSLYRIDSGGGEDPVLLIEDTQDDNTFEGMVIFNDEIYLLGENINDPSTYSIKRYDLNGTLIPNSEVRVVDIDGNFDDSACLYIIDGKVQTRINDSVGNRIYLYDFEGNYTILVSDNDELQNTYNVSLIDFFCITEDRIYYIEPSYSGALLTGGESFDVRGFKFGDPTDNVTTQITFNFAQLRRNPSIRPQRSDCNFLYDGRIFIFSKETRTNSSDSFYISSHNLI